MRGSTGRGAPAPVVFDEAEIVSQRRSRALRGEAVGTGGKTSGNDWCREYGSIRKGAGK